MAKLKVVHVVAGLWRENGGPSVVIPNLCLSLMRNNCDVTIITVDGNHSDELIFAQRMGIDTYSFKSITWSPIRYCIGMNGAMKNIIKDADIVHNHGLWLYPNWIALKWAKFYRKPLVLTPHGVLDPNLFNKKKYKKIIPWLFFDKNIVKYSSIIYALSESESDAIIKTVPYVSKKIKVIPNGVFIENISKINKDNSLSRFSKNKKLLFLSRVAPIKGIENLLYVWKKINSLSPKWVLLIAGPIDKKLEKYFADKIELGKSNIYYLGSLFGSEKNIAYNEADIFVLPSYGEGLPTVLLEAMSFSKPILFGRKP